MSFKKQLCYCILEHVGMRVCSVAAVGDPVDCSLLGSSAHDILQARILEWAAIPSSKDLLDRGTEPVSCTADRPAEPLGKPILEYS